MKPGSKIIARLCLLFFFVFSLTALPANSQRVTLGIDAGETSDRFGGLSRATTAEGIIEGQWVVIQPDHKKGFPDVVAGGEIRLPTNTSAHAPELAAYAGPMFWAGSHLSLGFHAQVRKVYLPTSNLSGVFFARDKMMLLELPAVLEYRSSAAARHAFFQAQISPEFSPHFTQPSSGPSPFPHPNLDHGYFLRGTAGYSFGKWYAKATYESRYFKFSPVLGNYNDLYNWRTDLITGGVGFVF